MKKVIEKTLRWEPNVVIRTVEEVPDEEYEVVVQDEGIDENELVEEEET